MRLKKIQHNNHHITKKNFLNALILILVIVIIIATSFTNTKRSVLLVINGEEIEYDTTALTTDKAYEQAKKEFEINDAQVEYTSNTVFNNDAAVKINTQKEITVRTLENISTINTYAVTFDEFKNSEEFKELGLTDEYVLVEADYTIIDPTVQENIKLNDKDHYYYAKKEIKSETLDEQVEQTEIKTDDPDMYEGEEEVTDEGQPEIKTTTYNVTYLDGKEITRVEEGKEVTQESKPRLISVGTKEKPEVNIDNGEVWDKLAQCEAGGNWAINTGNGYYGGLQINAGSWQSIAPGLGITASLPSEASREEQIAVGQVMQASGGWGQWPACSSQLGL